MSSNAGTWFYQEPENQPYMVTERLNSTFWGARLTDTYWKCLQTESPYQAEGYLGDHVMLLEWVPQQWLRLTAPEAVEMERIVRGLNERILGVGATLTYKDKEGHRIYEWHLDGGDERWSEVQGRPEFMQPKRLT